MRQLMIHVARGQSDAVVEAAREHDALSVSRWEATASEGPIDVVSIQVPNRSLGPLLEQVEGLPQLSILFSPHEVLGFMAPASEIPVQLKALEPRSALEVFLQSLQSIGTWSSFLAYALAGAIVVWIAFFTNSIYLLVSAMLIAPFAGPAMHVAVATAAGDVSLLKDSLSRYVVAIVTTVVVTGTLTFILQQEDLSNLMVRVSQVSSVSFLLPLVAGAAGALNLVESDRSNLVSGAAVGILVAASLAPPAGLIGVSVAMETWQMALNSTFLLLLQLVGINLSGSVVFRIFGLSSRLSRYEPGQRSLFYISIATSLVVLAALLIWQFTDPVRLERASEGALAAQAVRKVIRESTLATPVEVEARFPLAEEGSSQTLLVTAYAQARSATAEPLDVIAERLELAIRQGLLENNPRVVPLVDVRVLEARPKIRNSE